MLKSIHLENFRVLSGTRDFDLPEGLVGLVGPNGAGKSTLMNSVAWALYGAEALPLRARDPVSWGTQQALVRVTMELQDTWVVERSQRSSAAGAKAKLYIPGHAPKADGADPVTNAASDLLGVDREGFLVSVFARQFELDRLRSMEAPARMRTILRLLGIDQITKAIKTVKEETGGLRRELEQVRGTGFDLGATQEALEGLAGELAAVTSDIEESTHTVDSVRSRITELKTAQEAIAPQRSAHVAYLNKLQSLKTQVMFSESALNRAKVDADKPEPEKPIEPQYKEAVEFPSDEEVERSKLTYLGQRDKWSTAKAALDMLIQQRSDLKDTCPTCGRLFDNIEVIAHKHEEMDLKVEQLTSELEFLGEQGQLLKDQWESGIAANREGSAVIQHNLGQDVDYRAAVRQYEMTVAFKQQVKDKVTRAQHDLLEAQNALDALVLVPSVEEEDNRLRRALATEQELLNQHSTALARLEGDRKAVETSMESLKGQITLAKTQAGRVAELQRDVVNHETAAEELQKLKESMITGIIPSLNERASQLVETMTDGKYNELCLTTDYDIEYCTPQGEYKNFLYLSGGEQTVYALALRLAISDLRAGNLGVLFLDEVFASLSSEDGRQESVWNAVESLIPRYKQVIVSTHVQDYRDRADHVIRL